MGSSRQKKERIMKKLSRLLMILVISASGCQNREKGPMKIKYNEVNTITGIYTKSILTRKGLIGIPEHYKLRVNEELDVILLPPYDPESVREQAEVQRMEGRLAKVTGIIVEKTYMEEPDLESPVQSVDTPCFITIENIDLVE